MLKEACKPTSTFNMQKWQVEKWEATLSWQLHQVIRALTGWGSGSYQKPSKCSSSSFSDVCSFVENNNKSTGLTCSPQNVCSVHPDNNYLDSPGVLIKAAPMDILPLPQLELQQIQSCSQNAVNEFFFSYIIFDIQSEWQAEIQYVTFSPEYFKREW